MLILMAALGREQGNWHLAQEYWTQLSQWAGYLRSKGLDPENLSMSALPPLRVITVGVQAGF